MKDENASSNLRCYIADLVRYDNPKKSVGGAAAVRQDEESIAADDRLTGALAGEALQARWTHNRRVVSSSSRSSTECLLGDEEGQEGG
jgi:hypothetical protein